MCLEADVGRKYRAITFAVLAAALYAINIPASKQLLRHIAPAMLAAFLYFGAGLGMLAYSRLTRALGRDAIQAPLTKRELPDTVGMVLLDIIAPILLMLGIARTTSANVSLLNNFEIVVTSLTALLLFKERISIRLWVAIALISAARMLLGFEGSGSFRLNFGLLLVLCATLCWGLENNLTRRLSSKSSVQIMIVKGRFSGLGSLVVALVIGEKLPNLTWILAALLLGFVSYGLSINFYIRAQKELGAAKTSAYYAIAPFLAVAFSILWLGERPGLQFFVALLVMSVGTYVLTRDALSAPDQVADSQ